MCETKTYLIFLKRFCFFCLSQNIIILIEVKRPAKFWKLNLFHKDLHGNRADKHTQTLRMC